MNTATWLDHAFAEAESELLAFVDRVTEWRAPEPGDEPEEEEEF